MSIGNGVSGKGNVVSVQLCGINVLVLLKPLAAGGCLRPMAWQNSWAARCAYELFWDQSCPPRFSAKKTLPLVGKKLTPSASSVSGFRTALMARRTCACVMSVVSRNVRPVADAMLPTTRRTAAWTLAS
jgi:hypothetical protein